MGYLEQRNTIDRLIEKLSDDRKKFYLEKLNKIDARNGGGHRIGITALLSMLKTETKEK